MAYNEKAINALEPFNKRRAKIKMSFSDQRIINGITNALTMLVEEGDWNECVFEHLGNALTEQVNSLSPQNEKLCSTLAICLMEIQKHR